MASFQLAQLHSEREPTIIKASVHLLMVIVEGPSIIAMYKFYKCPIVITCISKNTNLKTLLLCYAQWGICITTKPFKCSVLSTAHVRNLGAHAYRKFNAANILVV